MPGTKLKVAKTLWGVPEAADPKKWDGLFARIKAEGFDGVEAITLVWRADTELFKELLKKHGLELICQIHTTGGDLDKAGEYVYLSSNKLHDHLAFALPRRKLDLRHRPLEVPACDEMV